MGCMSRGRLAIAACAMLAGCGRVAFEPVPCPNATDDTLEGLGTAEEPYEICSPAQVAAVVTRPENLDAYFILKQDLDFWGVPFDGIGAVGAPFTGRFDGNGHTIMNLTVTPAPGLPAGFVNVASTARIENLMLDRVTIVGSQQAGAVIGSCDRSQVRNAIVTAADVRGETNVGGLVGETSECQVIGASLSGSVEGSVGSIGGVVGAAGSSAFLNIDATVVVTAPLASAVGGVVGEDNWSPVILQNVSVQGDVVGNEDVGGIVGFNGDGSRIYRTRFEGTVRGTTGVGGFAGGNYDSPFEVYSTSVVADVTGNSGVGGFSGRHWYRTRFFDSYFRGTLTGAGANQNGFGGFFGDVEYYGWVERSYVDLTIDSSASTVGGIMGHIGYWSANSDTYDVVDSFSAANVTGSSATPTISRWVGENLDPNPLVGAGSYYWGGGGCVNHGGGGCGAGGTAVGDPSQLQTPGGPPLVRWDFERVWQAESGAFPTLRLEQLHAPAPTHACTGTAIVGLQYACDLTVVDADANEIQIATLEAADSCGWLSADVFALRGAPAPAHVGSCTAAFSVTDGLHTTAPQMVPIEVHLGVVLTPADTSGAGYSMGVHPVGSAAITQVFTLTNQEAVPVSLSVAGLPTNDFGFVGGAYPGTGGTCGATLAPAQTCTIELAYTPTTSGSVVAPVAIQFTAARGPVSYPFALAGHGL